MKKLTIIMNCRNGANHLRRSIGSVRNNIEGRDDVSFLFVDDASTDNTKVVAEELVGELGAVISTPHRMNVGGSRNYGVDYLRGNEAPEYVWFIDCDDAVPDGSVERIVDALNANGGVDILSIPFGELRYDKKVGKRVINISEVVAKTIDDAPGLAVGAWSKVIKFAKFVPFADNQMCEHVAWHYLQYDVADTWARIDGDKPCYIWDRTVDTAISETVAFCSTNSFNIVSIVADNTLVKKGYNDHWVSDFIRNFANMYDVRHSLKKPSVIKYWFMRFKLEYANLMTGCFVH